MESFSAFLEGLLLERGLSQSEFAKLTGSPHQTISSVLGAVRKPPKQPGVLVRWADALALAGERRDRFFHLADLARAPRSVCRRLDLLCAENARLKKQIENIRQRLRDNL